MARPLRLEFAGALYHATLRGDRREMIFESDDDRRAFLSVFDDVCETFNWECHAYCLVGNHNHCLIETISRALVHLIGIWLVLLLTRDQFVNDMQRRIKEPGWLSEILSSQRHSFRLISR